MASQNSSTENYISKVEDFEKCTVEFKEATKGENTPELSVQRSARIRTFCIHVSLFLFVTAYFIWATVFYVKNTENITWEVFSGTTCEGYGFLVILYIFYVYTLVYCFFIKPRVLQQFNEKIWEPCATFFNKIKYGSVIFYLSFLVAVTAYLVYDTADNRRRLVPLSGLCIFIAIGYVFSSSRAHIPWNTIIWGMILQFLFGLMTIRWETGRNVIQCVGNKVTTFLEFAFLGAAFAYGEELVDDYKVFAFRALSSIFLMGMVVNILYYYGTMQKIIAGLGQFLEWIMGTTVCESVNCAATIFLGMVKTT